jgi:hypothetical protein
MISNNSWGGVVRNSQSNPNKQHNNNFGKKKNSVSFILFGIVTDVDYSEENPGKITFTGVSGGIRGLTAEPANPNNVNPPIAGEVVLLISVPQKAYLQIGLNPNPFESKDNHYYYLTSVNVYTNPSLNFLLNNKQINAPSYPYYFSPEKVQNILPLMPCVGDILYEGRFGNSIRFGNTCSSVPNHYTQGSKENGDPITIIRNGISKDSSSLNGVPLNQENIKTDLSSIYLTSYQKISNFSLANENFNSYKTPPKTPADYINPQIILNSNQICINAREESVLISANKSVGISSNGTINIEATSEEGTIIQGRVTLGNKNKPQPAVLGNETVFLFMEILNQLKTLSDALEKSQVFPAGSPAPDGTMLSIAGMASVKFQKLLGFLNPPKGTSKILSNKVKISK